MIIMHHQGLGDHIICNGLIRHFAEAKGAVRVPCFKGRPLIDFMYRDDPRIEVFSPKHNEGDFLNELKCKDKNDYRLLGFDQFDNNFKNGKINFDKGFYHFANVDFSLRFSKFFIERDLEEEDRVYKELTGGTDDYIFIHDNPELGYKIDRSKIRKDLKIIENDLNINFFNFRKLFENAIELHVMQSGIFDFTNSIPLKKPKIFVHLYTRNYSDWYWAQGLNDRIKVS